MKTRLQFLLAALALLVGATRAASQCMPAPSGLAAWWPGNGNALDVAGGNNGALKGNAGFAPGKVGPAFSFDGSTGWVDIPNTDALNPTGPFSLEFWVNADPSQTDSQFLVVDKSHGFSDFTGWLFQGWSSSGYLEFGFGDGSGFSTVSTTNSILDNQWHHVAGIWDGTNIAIYLDGALQSTVPETTPPANNGRDMEIGSSWGGGSRVRYFHGMVDEMSYFNRALSPAEIQAIYTNNVGLCQLQPAVTSVSPTNGPVGTVVSFTGANFFAVTNVQFSGVSAAFSVSNAATMTATVPPGATTGPITLVAADGTIISAGSFTVLVTVPLVGLFNTGLDSSGTPVADATASDPHYLLRSVPDGSLTNLEARTSAGGYPIGIWSGDDNLSTWIGPANDSILDGPEGYYDYQTTFIISNADPATAIITGQLGSDDELAGIYINGQSTGITGGGPGWTPFTLSGATNQFVNGTNTLDFVVHNDYGSTGLRVEMTGQATACEIPSALVAWITNTLVSDASTLGAGGMAASDPRLDIADITGLTFAPVAEGAFGTSTPVPPGAPAGAEVVNIAPGDGESGYFMMTFVLPANYASIGLSGAANVDDRGRVFLNGHPLTPSMSSGDPNIVSEFGNVTFSTSDASNFQAGTNVILISDANTGVGPSGGAFYATIIYASPNPVNLPPALPALADITNYELLTLVVTNTATNPGSPAGPLTYALANPPVGASIDTNGVIAWTPAETQGSGSYVITSIVSNTVSGLTATNSFTVHVMEENLPPVLTIPGTQTIAANQTLSVSCSATNLQVPADPMTFSFVSAPAGMMINPTTGAILWTPTLAQAPSTNAVTVQVADSDAISLAATASFTVIVTANPKLTLPAARGTVVAWGDNTYRQTNVPSGLIAATMAAGYWHNLAVTAAGKVVAWGVDDYGQTNVPAGLSNVVAVAAGHDHSLALRTNGMVVGWGDDTYGQINIPLDLANSPGNAIAIAAGGFHSAALRADGTVECWGYDFYGQADPPPDLTNAIAIACGNAFSLALKADGTVVGWGDDFYGQIDIPLDLTNVVAIAAGGFHGIALKANGVVECWGYDAYGQADVPADLTSAASIAAGYFHSLAVKPDGTVEQWGDTSLGQLNGFASTNGVTANRLNRILSLAGGYAGSLALKDARIIVTNQPSDVTTNTGAVVKFTVGVTGATPLTYRWWFSGSVSNLAATLNTASFSNTLTLNAVTTNSAGAYFVAISNAAGVVTSSVANLTLYPAQSPAIITNPVSQTINQGSNATFSVFVLGAAPFSYQWYFVQTNFTGGFTNTVTTNAIPDATNIAYTVNNAQGTDAGRYFVVVSNVAGSTTSTNATLVVRIPPAITNQPPSVATNLGAVVKFTVMVTGTTPLTYRWWFNNSVSNLAATINSNSRSNTLTLNNVTSNSTGSYFVTVSNAAGVVTSSVANLTLYPAQSPAIITNPVSQTINQGSNATFSVFALGTEPFSYQWYFVQTNFSGGFTNTVTTNAIPDATNIAYTVSNAQATDAGCYFVAVANLAGSAISTNATLSVRIPPAITNQPADMATNVGAVVKFTVMVTGTTPLTYRWWFNNSVSNVAVTINSITRSNTLTLNNVLPTNAGPYFVTISNAAGVVTSSVAHLTVFYSQALTPAQLWLLGHFGSGDAIMMALEAGKNYRVQSSTDLQTWADVTNFLSSSTLMVYTNLLSTNRDSMFYRAVSP